MTRKSDIENRHEFTHHRILERVYNHALLVTPAKLETVTRVLNAELAIDLVCAVDEVPAEARGETPDFARASFGPMQIGGGTAKIPVIGTLVSRVSGLHPYSGMVGYDQLRKMYDEALVSSDVERIAFEFDTPGGEMNGCFALAEHIYQTRGRKPTLAVVSDHAYSAGYALASACDRIVMPASGGVGSVGVIAGHMDMSQAMDAQGIKVTVVYAGAHKADFSQYAPLTAQALKRMQADIDSAYSQFCDMVARNRGMSPASVRGTEALTYRGDGGMNIGFADAIMNPQEALSRFGAGTLTFEKKARENAASAAAPITTIAKEPTEMNTIRDLCENLGLTSTGKADEDAAQIVGLVKHLNEKASAVDATTKFLALHGAESLEEVTLMIRRAENSPEIAELRAKIDAMENGAKADVRLAELLRTGYLAQSDVTGPDAWARDAYMRDPDGFEKMVKNLGKRVPDNRTNGLALAGMNAAADNTGSQAGDTSPRGTAEERAEAIKRYGKEAVEAEEAEYGNR